MKTLSICPDCSGYVPDSAACPHCRVAAPQDSRAMRLLKRSLKFVGAGALTVTIAACYGAPVSDDSTIESIEVTGGTAVVVGTDLQLTATAFFADATTLDVTGTAVWTSNSGGIATVTGGLVTGVSPGAAVITATEDGIGGSTTVTVSASFADGIVASARADDAAPSGLEP